jgi:hypothetical protein
VFTVNTEIFFLLSVVTMAPEGLREAPKAGPLTVSASGSCPTDAAVTAALVPLIKLESVRNVDGPPRVTDLGDRFEVAAAGQVGLYADAARDCTERARVAAVFIALALNPPAFQARAARSTSPAGSPRKDDDRKDEKRDNRNAEQDQRPMEKPPTVEPPLAPSKPGETWARLMFGARLEAAPEVSGRPATTAGFGLDVQGAGGLDDFGVVIGAGVRAPTVSTFSSVSVREQRFPFSIAAAVRYEAAHSVELTGEAGMSLVILRLRDESPGGLLAPATRLDLGLRAGIALRLAPLSPRWSPFAIVSMEYFPRPYSYQVDPVGRIGTSAPVWVGTTLGLSFQAL